MIVFNFFNLYFIFSNFCIIIDLFHIIINLNTSNDFNYSIFQLVKLILMLIAILYMKKMWHLIS